MLAVSRSYQPFFSEFIKAQWSEMHAGVVEDHDTTSVAPFDPNDGALARLFMPDMQADPLEQDMVNQVILESMTAPQKAPELTEGQKRYFGLLESVELFDEKLAVLQEKYQTQRSQRYGEVYVHAEQEELRRANLTEEQRSFEDYLNQCKRSIYAQTGGLPISEEVMEDYLESKIRLYGQVNTGKLILSGAGKTAEFMGDTIDAGLTGIEKGTAWTAKHVFFASDDIAIGTGRFVRDTTDLATWVLPFAGTVKGISAVRYASRFAKGAKASGLAGLSSKATERLLSQFTKEELTTLRTNGILDDLAIKTKPSTGMMGETSQTKNIFEGLSDKARERLIWSMSPQELILLDRHGLLEGFSLKSNPKASMQPGMQMMEVEVGKSFGTGNYGFKSGSGIFNETPATWTAPVGTRQTYKVHQRTDIDWNMVRTERPGIADKFSGKTNLEAARAGLAPQLADGNFVRLHHSGQSSKGPIIEVIEDIHKFKSEKLPNGKTKFNVLHSQHGFRKPHPEFPVDHGIWSREASAYWKYRAGEIK